MVGAVGGALLFGIVAFVVSPTYVAETAIVQADPGRSGSFSGLNGLAARIGVATSAPVGNVVPLEFIRATATSRDVIDSVVLRPLVVDSPGGKKAINLFTFYKARSKDMGKRLYNVRLRVTKRLLRVTTDPRAGIVTFTFESRDPYVAASFLRRLIEVLNDFNLHTRHTTSHANRVFLEGRVAWARDQLDAAEGALQHFYEKNRRIVDAPVLIFEEGRLKRGVELSQQVYVTLSQGLEQARIDEIKDTPLLTIIETAQPPVRRKSPKRTLLILAGAFVGATGTFLTIAVTTYLAKEARRKSTAWEEFEQHLATVPGGPRLVRRVTQHAGLS